MMRFFRTGVRSIEQGADDWHCRCQSPLYLITTTAPFAALQLTVIVLRLAGIGRESACVLANVA